MIERERVESGGVRVRRVREMVERKSEGEEEEGAIARNAREG